MQLSNKSGICCDSCGMTSSNDFVYYSFDFFNVAVYDNRRPPLDAIIRSEIIFSVDICTSCFDLIKKNIIDNYSKTMGNGNVTKPFSPVVCEITGDKLVGTYEYYYCTVAKVNVKIAGQPYVCVKCKNKTFDDNKFCQKCSGNEFVRAASVNVDHRYVEASMCERAYKTFVTKAETIRKTAGQWATKS